MHFPCCWLVANHGLMPDRPLNPVVRSQFLLTNLRAIKEDLAWFDLVMVFANNM